MASLLAPADLRDRLAPMGTVEIELWPCKYRIKCTEAGCRNLARTIIHRVEAGGAPEGQSELCNKDVRAAAAAALADGIPVHDMRG